LYLAWHGIVTYICNKNFLNQNPKWKQKTEEKGKDKRDDNKKKAIQYEIRKENTGNA
jgi:hypothetical protein